MSEQFLNGTSAQNRPFQCHAGKNVLLLLPIGVIHRPNVFA